MSLLFNQPEFRQLHQQREAVIDQRLAAMGGTAEHDRFAVSRLKGLGGSDMSKLQGTSRWATPYKLWLDKQTDAPLSAPTLPMRAGTALEALVAELYSEKTGSHVYAHDSVAAAGLPFLRANFDRIIADEQGNPVSILECKTAGGNFSVMDDQELRLKWGPGNVYDFDRKTGRAVCLERDDRIDPEYYAQVQFYLMLAFPGWQSDPRFAKEPPHADVAVLIGNRDFRIYTVTTDTDYQSRMLAAADRFWCLNVLKNEPPEMMRDDFENYTQAVDDSVLEISEGDELLDLARSYKLMKKQQEEELGALRERIEAMMGEHAAAKIADGRKKRTVVSFKARMNSVFDEDNFKMQHPDLYRQCCTAFDADVLKLEHKDVYKQFSSTVPAGKRTLTVYG